MMLVTPAACTPVVQVREVEETTLGEVQATPPTVTVAPLTKPVPVIVIALPPNVLPPVGETLVTVGAG